MLGLHDNRSSAPTWSHEANTRALLSLESTKLVNLLLSAHSLPTIVLLLFAFLGLLRLRVEAGGEFGLGRNRDHWTQVR